MNPYYEDELITLYCGDCVEVLADLDESSVDAVFADPPYNVGLTYADHDDEMSADDYLTWCRAWFGGCQRVSRGAVVITPGTVSVPMWLADIERTHFLLAWTKANNMSRNYMGRTSGYQCWEPILSYGKSVTTILRDWINCPISMQSGIGDHPCPKPLRLMDWIVSSFTPDGGAILDPFAGSGTTLVAAKQLGRHAIGIELSEHYCDIIVSRLAQGSFFELEAQPA